MFSVVSTVAAYVCNLFAGSCVTSTEETPICDVAYVQPSQPEVPVVAPLCVMLEDLVFNALTSEEWKTVVVNRFKDVLEALRLERSPAFIYAKMNVLLETLAAQGARSSLSAEDVAVFENLFLLVLDSEPAKSELIVELDCILERMNNQMPQSVLINQASQLTKNLIFEVLQASPSQADCIQEMIIALETPTEKVSGAALQESIVMLLEFLVTRSTRPELVTEIVFILENLAQVDSEGASLQAVHTAISLFVSDWAVQLQTGL